MKNVQPNQRINELSGYNWPNCWEGLKTRRPNRLGEEGLPALPLKSMSYPLPLPLSVSSSATCCCPMRLYLTTTPMQQRPPTVAIHVAIPACKVVWKMGNVPLNPDTEWQLVSVSITTLPHTDGRFFFLQRSAASKERSRKTQEQSSKVKALENRDFQAPIPHFPVFCNTWRHL